MINPGSTTEVLVPDLNISDYEDVVPTTVTITRVPINATLYYAGVEVTDNTTFTDFNASKFTVDPNNGEDAVFNYTVTDRAGVLSDEATVTLPFVALKITGNMMEIMMELLMERGFLHQMVFSYM